MQFNVKDFTLNFSLFYNGTDGQQEILMNIRGAKGELLAIVFAAEADGSITEVSDTEYRARIPISRYLDFRRTLETLETTGQPVVSVSVRGPSLSVSVSGSP